MRTPGGLWFDLVWDEGGSQDGGGGGGPSDRSGIGGGGGPLGSDIGGGPSGRASMDIGGGGGLPGGEGAPGFGGGVDTFHAEGGFSTSAGAPGGPAELPGAPGGPIEVGLAGNPPAGWATAPNPTTPGFTNLDVLGFGQQNPIIGKIARVTPGILGLFTNLALRQSPDFSIPGSAGGFADRSGRFEGESVSAGPEATALADAASSTGAGVGGGSSGPSLSDLLDALSLPGGSGGAGSGSADTAGYYAPTTGSATGSLLGWLLIAAAIGFGIYWWYTHRKKAS